MSSRASGARFRQRKLNTKHPLPVLREDDVSDVFGDENDPTRHIPHVETGVERHEETEHHLQAVISASAAASLGGKVAQVFIPTPETKSSAIRYDELYPKNFQSPQTYIRFSSTVEDCIGAPYCMSEEDDKFFESLNEKKAAKDGSGKCSEDLFEEVMSFFEEIAEKRQPFAAIDMPPVLTFEELEAAYDDTIGVEARKWASDIYPHWQTRRLESENRPLMPSLKFEAGKETDDSDAYVCFRRREVRQVRKTRGRDAQVTEKLKKLRRELEEARALVSSINEREKLIAERYSYERKVFEQRSELKRVKIQHGIKGDKAEDEELLVNQRPAPKPKSRPEGAPQRPATLRLSTSQRDTRAAPENDLVQLDDTMEDAALMVKRAVETKIGKHRDWNRGWIDHTWAPITPPLEASAMSSFLPRIEEFQLPTPPASVTSDRQREGADVEMKDTEKEGGMDLPTPVSDAEAPAPRTMYRFGEQKPDSAQTDICSFRRRFGRNGRLHIEECRPRTTVLAEHSGVVYDSDGDDEDQTVVYPVEYYGNWALNYRASLLSSRGRTDPAAEHAARRSSSHNDVAMANGQSTAGQQSQSQAPPAPVAPQTQ